MQPLSNLRTLTDAREIFFSHLPPSDPAVEKIETFSSMGRIIAQTIVSFEFLPAFNRSAMDGYAVHASDTHGASSASPINLKIVAEIAMGESSKIKIGSGKAAIIHTGGMLPAGCDAVVIRENVTALNNHEIQIQTAVKPGDNILQKGADVRPGDVLIPAGRCIRVEEVAGLLALGFTQVDVFRPPRIAIISSGNELVPPDQPLEPGKVRDINTGALCALVQQAGGIPLPQPILPDLPADLEKSTRQALLEADAVVITAGSSVGERDMTAAVIEKLGQPGILVHGMAIRPGKPTLLAVCEGKAVIGLPGNPVSALVIARLLLVDLIHKLAGASETSILPVRIGRLTRSLKADTTKETYIPAIITTTGGQLSVEPVEFKSNFIFTLVKSDALIRIPIGSKAEQQPGDSVEVLL